MQTNNLLTPDQLIKGRIYKIESRNLSYGVWDGNTNFIGIRTKFGDRFLDIEQHWDSDGTVTDTIDTGINIPDDIDYQLNLKLFNFLDKVEQECKVQENV